MFNAIREQTSRAISTARGSAPPVKITAAPRLNDTAEAGAMVVIDWNKTPGRPIALGRRVVCSEDEDEDSTAIWLLLWIEPDDIITRGNYKGQRYRTTYEMITGMSCPGGKKAVPRLSRTYLRTRVTRDKPIDIFLMIRIYEHIARDALHINKILPLLRLSIRIEID
jgi:hypothetical protein